MDDIPKRKKHRTNGKLDRHDDANDFVTNDNVKNVTNGEVSNDNVAEEPVLSPKTPEQQHNSIDDVTMATKVLRVLWKDEPSSVEEYNQWFLEMFPISPKSTDSNDGEGTSAQTRNVLELVPEEKNKTKVVYRKNCHARRRDRENRELKKLMIPDEIDLITEFDSGEFRKIYAVQHLRTQKHFKFTPTTIEESLKTKVNSKENVHHVSMARFNPLHDTFVPEHKRLNSMILAMYTAHVNNLPFKLYPHDVWLLIVQGMSHVSKSETGFYDNKLFKVYDRAIANLMYRGKRKRVEDDLEHYYENILDGINEKVESEMQLAVHQKRVTKSNVFYRRFSTSTVATQLTNTMCMFNLVGVTNMDEVHKKVEAHRLKNVMKTAEIDFKETGISSIMIGGTKEDWNLLMKAVHELKTYGHYEPFLESIIFPVLLQIQVTACGFMNVENMFWYDMFNVTEVNVPISRKETKKYTLINGWITRFFPHLTTNGFGRNGRPKWMPKQQCLLEEFGTGVSRMGLGIYFAKPIGEGSDSQGYKTVGMEHIDVVSGFLGVKQNSFDKGISACSGNGILKRKIRSVVC